MKVEVEQGKQPIVDLVFKHFETEEAAYFFISIQPTGVEVYGFGGCDKYTSILLEKWNDSPKMIAEPDNYAEVKFYGAKLITYLPRKNGIDIVALKTNKSETEVVYEFTA